MGPDLATVDSSAFTIWSWKFLTKSNLVTTFRNSPVAIIVVPCISDRISSIRGAFGIVGFPSSHSRNLAFLFKLENFACDCIQTFPFISPFGVTLMLSMYAYTKRRADSSVGMSVVR